MLPALTLRSVSMPRALASLKVGFEFAEPSGCPPKNRPGARTSFLTGAHRLRKHNGMATRPLLSNTILFHLSPFADCRVAVSVPVPSAGYGAVARVRLRAGRSRGPQQQHRS